MEFSRIVRLEDGTIVGKVIETRADDKGLTAIIEITDRQVLAVVQNDAEYSIAVDLDLVPIPAKEK